MKKTWFLMTLIVIIMFSTIACNKGIPYMENNGINQSDEDTLKIFTTFYPMYFITKEIAKDKAEIINMIPAGVEPHNWEPTLKSMAELQNSDMLVYNGANMERWIEKVINNIDTNKTKVVEASIGVELIKGEGHHQEDYDPHVWVSPVNLKQQAENVLNALIEKDEINKDYYKANYENLSVRLDKLNKDIQDASKNFNKKIIVTSHEAFGYFAKEYGITQIPIRGISPEQEPSPAKLAEIVKLCKDNNIKYVFVERFVNPKFSNTIANEINGEVLTLNAAHGLTEEELKVGQDYITVMYDNLESLKKALN